MACFSALMLAKQNLAAEVAQAMPKTGQPLKATGMGFNTCDE